MCYEPLSPICTLAFNIISGFTNNKESSAPWSECHLIRIARLVGSSCFTVSFYPKGLLNSLALDAICFFTQIQSALCRYGFSRFAIILNELTEGLQSKIAPTDCRLRPDQHCLEIGLYDEVGLLLLPAYCAFLTAIFKWGYSRKTIGFSKICF